PAALDVHLVIDNYATRKHPAVRAWLAARPRSTCTTRRPTRRGSIRSSAGSGISRSDPPRLLQDRARAGAADRPLRPALQRRRARHGSASLSSDGEDRAKETRKTGSSAARLSGESYVSRARRKIRRPNE